MDHSTEAVQANGVHHQDKIAGDMTEDNAEWLAGLSDAELSSVVALARAEVDKRVKSAGELSRLFETGPSLAKATPGTGRFLHSQGLDVSPPMPIRDAAAIVRAAKKIQAGKGKAEVRLPRRSKEAIAMHASQVAGLVAKAKEGMRAEKIREALHFDVREMPAILKAGVASKLLRTKGQKRATTYFARAAG